MPAGESKKMPLKPGDSRGEDQAKAIKAPQSKSHNSSVSDAKGFRPTVKK